MQAGFRYRVAWGAAVDILERHLFTDPTVADIDRLKERLLRSLIAQHPEWAGDGLVAEAVADATAGYHPRW